MKKRKIAVSLLCAAALLGVSVATLTSCGDKEDPEPPVVEPEKKEYSATLKYNNGAADGSLKAVKDGDSYYFEQPTEPKKEYNEFGGWFTDADCKNPYNFDNAVTDNITLYAKWSPAYDTVNTIWDFAACAATIKENPSGNVVLTEDMTFGSFTLGSGARFEIKGEGNNCVNTQKKVCQFVLSGDGTNNGFTMNVKWASSSSGTFKIVKKGVDGAADEEIFSQACANGDAAFDVSKSNLTAGTYAIEANGSVRIYALSLSQKLAQGPTNGIELNTSGVQTDFLLGREFDNTGLEVFLTYENGRKDPVVADNYTVSTPDMTTAGEKEITITYHKDQSTTYTKSYKINVYKAESLKVYDYVLDSKRITKNAKALYKVGEKLDTSCIAIKAVCKVGDTDTIEFLLNSNEYTLGAFDSAAVGSKSVSVTYGYDNAITSAINVEVINVPDLSKVTTALLTVDPTQPISTNETYNFHTINQALQFIKLANINEGVTKNIVLAPSTVYNEKVEIDVPNVSLSTKLADEDKADVTKYAVIEFGVLNGMLDPSETITHSTDGSATVSIRSTAKNFSATNVTFKNSFNTYELYQKSLTITTDSQAVALLCQADQAVFDNCFFTSYHDTLYAQKGRQLYLNCTIEGHTDYIFGYDATAYFKGCTIRSIGAGAEVTNGGYVVATKGNPDGKPTDPNYKNIIYGYVFDGCTFTADENTMAGSVSIARGWADGMAVIVMNSNIDNHFSKEAYGNSESKLNDRYGKMQAAPVASQLLEYKNTGDGSISESIADTCTVLTDAQAATLGLTDKPMIHVFTPNNGTTSYTEAWGGDLDKDATVILKNADDTVAATLENISYVDSVLTENMLRNTIEAFIPAGFKFAGLFTDKELATAYDYNTLLTAESTLYVKWEESAKVSATTVSGNDVTAGELTTEVKVKDIITFVGSADKKFTVDGSAKTIKDAAGADLEVTQRIKTGGATTEKGRYIKIDLSEFGGKAKIQVYAMTGSSSTAREAYLLKDVLADDAANRVGTINCPAYDSSDPAASVPTLSEFTVDCGHVYYIWAGASVNYYGINIIPVTE